jgi:hypothetical protein
MKTVTCPACQTVNENAEANSACRSCGRPLAAALLEQSIADLRQLTEKASRMAAPRKTFYTFNGFGTTLLDYRPAGGDGTYEATRWVTAMFVPLVPLADYVVRPREEERSYGRESYRFEVVERKGLSWGRVVRTYLLASVGVAVPALYFWNGKAVERAIGPYPAVGLALVAIVFGGYVIFYRIKNEHTAYKKLKGGGRAASPAESNRQESN